MKLNLLPKHVAKAQGSKGMFFVMLVIIAVCCVVTFAMIGKGRTALADAKEQVPPLQQQVGRALGNSAMADTVISEVTLIDRNLKLTQAMLAHNTAYVDLYREVLGYVPSFYRITNLTASPAGAEGCTVNMTGVLQTHRQYADLVAAIYRMPNVVSVSRGGFAQTDPFVPNLTEQDQLGTSIAPGEGNLPSDPEERLAAIIQRAASQQQNGYLGVNGFGDPTVFPKGAMPEWSTVTLTIQIAARNIQTPDPQATLNQSVGAATASAPAGFAGGPAGFAGAGAGAGAANQTEDR